MANLAFSLPEDALWRVRIAAIGKIICLYAVLVLYGMAFEYFYANQLTPLFHNDFTIYDASRPGIYRLAEFLTPLALLPIGTRLQAPGQYIVGALGIFLFIPIPLVFVSMVTTAEFWPVYAALWTGFLAASVLSSISVQVALPNVPERAFRQSAYALLVFFAGGLAYCAATNHLSFVVLDEAHAARDLTTASGLQVYLLVSYITSFGGLTIALAVMLRKYFLIAFALVGFVICYAVLSERNAALMPAWIAYMYFAYRLFFGQSTIRYFLALMAPFLFGELVAFIIGPDLRTSILYAAFTLANYRLYSIPAIGFNVYYNFFHMHAFTYWSHIGIVSNFVAYPYLAPLSVVMESAVHLGNYNAAFIETDGLAAGGVNAIPFASLVFGLVVVFINSCMRGLNPALLALVLAGPSVGFVDTGIGPALFTNGIGPLSLFLLFAPRDAPWNLRYLVSKR